MQSIKVICDLVQKLSTITCKPCCIKYYRCTVKVKTNSFYHGQSLKKIRILQTKFEFGKTTNLTSLASIHISIFHESSFLGRLCRRQGDNDIIAMYHLYSVLPPPCCGYALYKANLSYAMPVYCCTWNYKNNLETLHMPSIKQLHKTSRNDNAFYTHKMAEIMTSPHPLYKPLSISVIETPQ